MKPDQERVKNLLTDTVTLLCKNGLNYNAELRVEGLLGITLDNNEVFLVHINEKFNSGGPIVGGHHGALEAQQRALTLLAKGRGGGLPGMTVDLTGRGSHHVPHRMPGPGRPRFPHRSPPPTPTRQGRRTPQTPHRIPQSPHPSPGHSDGSRTPNGSQRSQHSGMHGTINIAPDEHSSDGARPNVKAETDEEDDLIILPDNEPKDNQTEGDVPMTSPRDEGANSNPQHSIQSPNVPSQADTELQQTYSGLELSLGDVNPLWAPDDGGGGGGGEQPADDDDDDDEPPEKKPAIPLNIKTEDKSSLPKTSSPPFSVGGSSSADSNSVGESGVGAFITGLIRNHNVQQERTVDPSAGSGWGMTMSPGGGFSGQLGPSGQPGTSALDVSGLPGCSAWPSSAGQGDMDAELLTPYDADDDDDGGLSQAWHVQHSGMTLAEETDQNFAVPVFWKPMHLDNRKSRSCVSKPYPCMVPGCSKSFFHQTHTRRHERRDHGFYRRLGPKKASKKTSGKVHIFDPGQ